MATPRRNFGNHKKDWEKDAAVRFGVILRSRREALGYSRPQVAKRTKIAVPTILSYEKGDSMMPVNRAIIFGDFLDISLEEIAAIFARPEYVGRKPHRDFAEARSRLGYSIGEMSDHLGVSPKTIREWELGETAIPADVLEQLAEHVDPSTNLTEQ